MKNIVGVSSLLDFKYLGEVLGAYGAAVAISSYDWHKIP